MQQGSPCGLDGFSHSLKYKVTFCPCVSQPGKALYTSVRELVENGLDAAESIGEFPLLEIKMRVLPSPRNSDLRQIRCSSLVSCTAQRCVSCRGL